MLAQDTVDRMLVVIEEELGSYRAFADLPASEIEVMAARLAKAMAPFVAGDRLVERRDAA